MSNGIKITIEGGKGMKVADLTGALLDYWVARALGYQPDIAKLKPGGGWCAIEPREASVARPCSCVDPCESVCAIGTVPNAVKPFPACILGNKVGRGKCPWRSSWFYPSTLWDHGGPIIDREYIDTWHSKLGTDEPVQYHAQAPRQREHFRGGSYLEAAMRAYVASIYGDEVPDEVRP